MTLQEHFGREVKLINWETHEYGRVKYSGIAAINGGELIGSFDTASANLKHERVLWRMRNYCITMNDKTWAQHVSNYSLLIDAELAGKLENLINVSRE